MANARVASLLAQRKSSVGGLYGTSGKIRILSPSNNSVATIAKQAASSELDVMTAKYNNGEISNEEMRAFLEKLSTNIGLSASDKLDVSKQISDFDNRVIGEKLQANYKAAPDNSIQQMQAAQQLANFYNGRASTQQPGTPAQSQSLQDAATWNNQVTSIKQSMAKTATQSLRYQEELKVNALPDGTSEQATQKASMWKSLYDKAVADGDSVGANKYAANYTNAITDAKTLADKEATSSNKKKLSDFINTTINDYHDGKIPGDEALTQLEEANKFAYDQGDTAALNRLNGLSVTINNEIDKGVTYSSINGLSQKNKSGGGEVYLNPDGSLSVGGGVSTTGGSGNNVSVSTSGGINPLIQKYFPKDQWATAQAVMLAESGGNTGAIGDNFPINGQTIPSYGLFQIRGLPGRPDAKTLMTPEANVAYAAQMWKTQGWQPWSAYTNGSYRQYLGQASSSGNGAVITSKKALGGSGDAPKSLSQLAIEHQNNLNDANKALLQGFAIDDATGKKVKFGAKEYMTFMQAASMNRQLQLQNITKGYATILAGNPKAKLNGKEVLGLQKDATTELQSVTAEFNGIKSGNLVLSMGTKNITDASGNQISTPELQFVTKDKVKNHVESKGIYYPTREEGVSFPDEAAARSYVKLNSTKDSKLGLIQDQSGNWTVVDSNSAPIKKNLLDITDTQGNVVTYENNDKYGWLPKPVGPKTTALRNQIIKEADAAEKTGQSYKSNLLTYNELNNSDFKTPVGITQPAVKPESTGIKNVVAPIAEKINSVVSPASPYKTPEQLNLPSTPPIQSANPNPAIKSNLSVPTYTAPSAPPVTQIKLATQQPSPVAKLAQTIKTKPVAIPAPVIPVQKKATDPISKLILGIGTKIQGLFK